jgi:hypothetical protein
MPTPYIFAIGKIVDGDIFWDIAPLPMQDEPQDGEIQQLIEEAEMTEDYINFLEDLDFWRNGQW